MMVFPAGIVAWVSGPVLARSLREPVPAVELNWASLTSAGWLATVGHRHLPARRRRPVSAGRSSEDVGGGHVGRCCGGVHQLSAAGGQLAGRLAA